MVKLVGQIKSVRVVEISQVLSGVIDVTDEISVHKLSGIEGLRVRKLWQLNNLMRITRIGLENSPQRRNWVFMM